MDLASLTCAELSLLSCAAMAMLICSNSDSPYSRPNGTPVPTTYYWYYDIAFPIRQ